MTNHMKNDEFADALLVALYTNNDTQNVLEGLFKAAKDTGFEGSEKPESTRRQLFFSVLLDELYGLRDTFKELGITHVLPDILEEETAHRKFFLKELLAGNLGPTNRKLKEENIRYAFRKLSNQDDVEKLVRINSPKNHDEKTG